MGHSFDHAETSSRQSNFELLRIFCMILIIAHHFSVHSIMPENISMLNRLIFDVFAIGGKVAVNVFVLISGYFMVKSKFKIQKLLMLIFQTFFYSIAIYIILCICGICTLNINQLFSYFFRFYNKYWFMTNYLILYAISPFLNKIICSSNKNTLKLLIICAILLQTQILGVDLGNLIWFCTLYIISGYIRIYPNQFTNKFYLAFTTAILSFIVIILFYALGQICLWDLKNIVCLLLSISLFCTFKNIKIRNNKIINFISSTTLGIYLIHDNRLLRPMLWGNWLNVNTHALYSNFWIFAISAVLLVFVVCSLIEMIRRLIEKKVLKLIFKQKTNINS